MAESGYGMLGSPLDFSRRISNSTAKSTAQLGEGAHGEGATSYAEACFYEALLLSIMTIQAGSIPNGQSRVGPSRLRWAIDSNADAYAPTDE